MRIDEKLTIDCILPGDGSVCLHGSHQEGAAPVRVVQLALFSWHERSGYGTDWSVARVDGTDCVVIPAEMAVLALAEAEPISLVRVEWTEQADTVRRMARLLQRVLATGAFAPSLAKLRTGQRGWALRLADAKMQAEAALLGEACAKHGLPMPEDWLDRTLEAWLASMPELGAAWGRVVDAHPGVRVAPTDSISPTSAATTSVASVTTISTVSSVSPTSVATTSSDSPTNVAVAGTDDGTAEDDQEDWLIAIGWKSDDAPFRIGLQLEEPTDDSAWTLAWVLQDRRDPQRSWTCGMDGRSGAPLPAEWSAYAPERLTRMARKAVHAVPRLSAAAMVGGHAGTTGDIDGGVGVDGVDDVADIADLAAGNVTGTAKSGKSAASATIAAGAKRKGASTAMAERTVPLTTPTLKGQLDTDEAWMFLEEDSLRLVEAGLFVRLPDWWEEVRRWKPRLKASVRSSVGVSANPLFGLQQIIDFDWKVALGGLDLSEEEFRRVAAEKHRLVRVQGRWVQLDPELITELRKLRKQTERTGLRLRDVLELHLLGGAGDEAEETGHAEADSAAASLIRLEVELNEHLRALLRQLQETTELPLLPKPASLQADLRGYQEVGASWLAFLRRFGLGGCLADDMGLGKTIQFITYLLHVRGSERPDAPALLIAPTSVLGNWQKELRRFAPDLDVRLHYGPGRAKSEAFPASVAGADLVLITYTLANLDEQELGMVHWDAICLDEAQNIKNAYSKQSIAIRRLNAVHRIALTGTPIENRLTELWSIFDFLNPGYLGGLSEFSRKFVNEIERTRNAERIEGVQRLVRPFLLRRLKKDPRIQLDLPEKNEAKAYVSLTAEQGALYEETVQELLEKIEKSTAMERRGLILGALTKLKQICNHPATYMKEELEAAARETDRSNKLTRLLELLREMREEGEQGLVFTQYVEMGKLLQHVIARELGEPVSFLHGGVTRSGRDRMIAEFQEGGGGVMILSLKAGGTGLNLTAANHVFHYDRWWNPAVENQATDRAFRIGQTRDVQVHKFVTLGTLEERIDDMIERKLSLATQIVGAGENWITELSTDELRELFVLRREWVG